MHRFIVLMVLATGCVSSNKETSLDAGSGGTSSAACDEMRQAVENTFYELIDTSRSCTADSDCTIVNTLSCLGGCPTSVNRQLAGDAGAYAEQLCAPFRAQGCGPTPGWHGCLACPGPICYVDAGTCYCAYGMN